MVTGTDSLIGKAITQLRFPLIVAIVMVHSDPRPYSQDISSLPVFNCLADTARIYILFPCLYVFFFISGLLFFRNGVLDRRSYAHKMRNRVRTLLTPYLLWNGMTLLTIFVIQLFRPTFSAFLKRPVTDFNWYDYLLIFWDKQAVTHNPDDPHGPLLLQFWFIQSLVVICVLSPLIYYGIRKSGSWFIILMSVLMLSPAIPDYAGLNKEAFFYFSLGAYFSIYPKRLSLIGHPRRLAAALLVTGIISWFCYQVQVLYKISFILLMLSGTCKCLEKSPATKPVVSGSAVFFIFAFHIFLSGIIMNAIGMLPVRWTEPTAVIAFMSGAVLNVTASLLVYRLMRHYQPAVCRILCGERDEK